MTASLAPNPALTDVRDRIDAVDRQLILLLVQRQKLVETAAGLKGVPGAVRDPIREAQVLEQAHQAALAAGLSPMIAGPLWRRMIACFTLHQITWLNQRHGPAGPD